MKIKTDKNSISTRKKNRRRFHQILSAFFLTLLVLFALLFVILPDKKFSDIENRNLATLPSLKLRTIADGRFESDFTNYVSDQFPFRTFFVQMKTLTDRLMGKDCENGVYAGSDGYLIEETTVPSAESQDHLISAIRTFHDTHTDIPQYFLLAPNAVSILKDKLPKDAPVKDQNTCMDEFFSKLQDTGITAVDVRGTLSEEKDSGIFYKTDHHWTTRGAFLSFETLASAMGLDATSYEYSFLPVSTNFSGTLSAKSGLNASEKDTIEIAIPKKNNTPATDYIVEYIEEKEKTTVFYNTDKLKTRDQYGIFLNGNHAEIRIRTTSSNSEKLLILKDSYANSLIPYLAPYYREIFIVDPRYCYEDVETLMKTEGINEVLYLYNANTLFADSDLVSYLGSS